MVLYRGMIPDCPHISTIPHCGLWRVCCGSTDDDGIPHVSLYVRGKPANCRMIFSGNHLKLSAEISELLGTSCADEKIPSGPNKSLNVFASFPMGLLSKFKAIFKAPRMHRSVSSNFCQMLGVGPHKRQDL